MQTQCVQAVDSRGCLVIPSKLRELLGIKPGTLVILDVEGGSLRLRPAIAVPVETYTQERRAEFLLNNAVDDAEYRAAAGRVRKLGLDPDKIPHEPPRGTQRKAKGVS